MITSKSTKLGVGVKVHQGELERSAPTQTKNWKIGEKCSNTKTTTRKKAGVYNFEFWENARRIIQSWSSKSNLFRI